MAGFQNRKEAVIAVGIKRAKGVGAQIEKNRLLDIYDKFNRN